MTSSVILTQLILLSISQQAFSRPSDTSDDGVETQPDNYLLSFGDGVSGDLASRAVGHESATVISASTYNAGSKPPSQTKPGIVTGQGKPEASSTGQANPTGSLNPSLTTPSSGSSQPKPPGSSQTFSELLSSLFGSSGGVGSVTSSFCTWRTPIWMVFLWITWIYRQSKTKPTTTICIRRITVRAIFLRRIWSSGEPKT